MGILSRLNRIMKANMNTLPIQSNNPEKELSEYMRQLNMELGAVKAETAAVLLSERRAKTLLDECNAEIEKLQRYAEKSVEEGNDSRALSFLDKKSKQMEKLAELTTAYELASMNAKNIKLIEEKLVSDIGQLELRRMQLKEKLAQIGAIEGMTGGNTSSSSINAVFERVEAEANFALDKAEALAELKADEQGDDISQKYAYLNQDTTASNEVTEDIHDELAAIKKKHHSKE